MPRAFGVLMSAPDGDYPCPERLEIQGGSHKELFSEMGVVLLALYPDFMANLRAQLHRQA